MDVAPDLTRTRAGERVWDPAEAALAHAPLSGALLATLAYHDLLELPLTAVECWRYLLRPRAAGEAVGSPTSARGLRGTSRQWAAGIPALRDVERALTALVQTDALGTKHGFYFFPGRAALVVERVERRTQSMVKWRRLRRIVFWLQAVPFLRGVAGTGSLAFENAKQASDLDVLIIASEDRVWMVRFLLTVLLDLFHLRRRPTGPTKHRVCLNHYLAADALVLPYRSLYTAMEYARLVPLLGIEMCWAFRAANRSWMADYLVQVFPDTVRPLREVRPSRVLRLVQRLGEAVLAGPTGDAFERLLARLQRERIARAGAATALGRVVATAARAEFHPQSREAPLLAAFNQRMEALGLAALFGGQRDSGLTA